MNNNQNLIMISALNIPYHIKTISLVKQGLIMMLIMALLSLVLPARTFSQTDGEPDISLDLNIDEQLSNAQVISLTSLGIDRRGRGQQLARLMLRNNENRKVNDLYFNFVVESSQHGQIATGYQSNNRPFSLDANQVVNTNNNMIQDGINQIEEKLYFDSELTSSGEELYNELEGSTRLPNDIYTLNVKITQNQNLEAGGNVVAEATATIGSTPSVEMRDIYLQTPGGETGEEAIINTSYPEFAWDGGAPNATYRLLVVEDNESDSPEDLIQSAKSTQAALVESGGSGEGSLLEFENVDALLNRSTFQYPSSGVQSLESGQTYYWQVIAMIRGAGQTEEVSSEIWSFSLESGPGDVGEIQEEQLQTMLEELLGTEQYNQLQDQGYDLQSIIINGQTLEGPAAATRLSNFMEKVRTEEVTVTVEQ